MENKNTYGKRPLWQWVVLYIVIGLIVYGLIYYFGFYNKGASAPYTQSQPKSGY